MSRVPPYDTLVSEYEHFGPTTRSKSKYVYDALVAGLPEYPLLQTLRDANKTLADEITRLREEIAAPWVPAPSDAEIEAAYAKRVWSPSGKDFIEIAREWWRAGIDWMTQRGGLEYVSVKDLENVALHWNEFGASRQDAQAIRDAIEIVRKGGVVCDVPQHKGTCPGNIYGPVEVEA